MRQTYQRTINFSQCSLTQADIDALTSNHQAEVQQILKDAATKLGKFKEALETRQSQVSNTLSFLWRASVQIISTMGITNLCFKYSDAMLFYLAFRSMLTRKWRKSRRSIC
jgi:hypothetical protein